MAEWPHAPARRKIDVGTYLVTAGTLNKERVFYDRARLDLVESTLLEVCAEFRWNIQSWAVFSTHYHFIASTPEEDPNLKLMLNKLHGCTARALNRLDDAVGRQVWFRYWDTRITNERSYLARLSYVHRNPVKHGLASAPEMYEWCSADWFRKTADAAFFKTATNFPCDRVKVIDDF